ncbi:MAG: TonB-dependent receptor [Gammaproteobacteria bacterium]|nr:TonB-dependent receptor [Gammaproteobacteria bacterium]
MASRRRSAPTRPRACRSPRRSPSSTASSPRAIRWIRTIRTHNRASPRATSCHWRRNGARHSRCNTRTRCPGGDLTWQAEYIHTGPTELTAFGPNGNNPAGHRDAYGLANGRISLELENGLSIALWGRNLTDEVQPTRYQDLSFPPIFSTFQALSEPRTYGIDLVKKF